MREGRLGVTLEKGGASFASFSAGAEAVELCVFDGDHERRVPMRRSGDEWHAHVPGAGPGTRYGYRVYGPYEPARGHRFNAAKLLVDPYARAFDGKIDYRGPVFGFDRERGDGVPDLRDDAAFVPKSVVVDDAFDWRGDRSPRIPWRDTLLYELHLKGFSKRNPAVDPALRGTYLGLAADASIAHLRSLGVTAVELLPIHECLDEWTLAARGMKNYWGYSTLGFFAPDQRFAARPGNQVAEFKEMVRRLHAAGIEVILDVVFNHTCEGDQLGPTVSFRGLDNVAYYKLSETEPRTYVDYTGCGNTFDTSQPHGVRLVCDALRYWIDEMHVDGFRFDLAPALGRANGTFDPDASLFHALFQDPVLGRAKLIAEPWDCAVDPVQLGKFPAAWREWNNRFRDDVRRFWTAGRPGVGPLATRLAGSSDVFAGRGPTASIDFVTAHDGFTLRDLVSYEKKHNEANGEKGKDGSDQNDSTNLGVEGETGDRAVALLRLQLARSMLATLLFSSGVPMVTAGDESWRTQGGNNNPYVLDDETSWLDWDHDADAREMLDFFRAIVRLRRELPTARAEKFFVGGAAALRKDVTWFGQGGIEIEGETWDGSRVLGAWLTSSLGDFVMLANGGTEQVAFALPLLLRVSVAELERVVDTTSARVPFAREPFRSESTYPLAGRSLAVLRARR